MARIRLLVPVAGHLADGVPAPAVGVPVDVDEATAATWCDAELAELVPDVVDVEAAVAAAVELVHADAQVYLAAVLEQHASELAALKTAPAETSTPPKPKPTAKAKAKSEAKTEAPAGE